MIVQCTVMVLCFLMTASRNTTPGAEVGTAPPPAAPEPKPAPVPEPAKVPDPETLALKETLERARSQISTMQTQIDAQHDERAKTQESLERARTQISALQTQIDAQHDEREKTQARLQEMADRMALVIKQNSFVPSADATKASTADAAQVAAMLPTVTPATSELLLLKERNRLTDYADRAIATGQRRDLQAVVDSMFDPALSHLRHAAEAEFRRVQAYYEINMSIDPGYKLPLQELFKDGTVQAEADLTDAQLTTLLQDHKQPWEVRLRCAYLLRSSQDPAVNATLLRAVREDPSLDVAKQAQTSLEKRVSRRFRLFDIPSIDAWWQTQQPVK